MAGFGHRSVSPSFPTQPAKNKRLPVVYPAVCPWQHRPTIALVTHTGTDAEALAIAVRRKLPDAVSYAAWRTRGYASEIWIVNRQCKVTHVVLMDSALAASVPSGCKR
jgi:hypothetical protein